MCQYSVRSFVTARVAPGKGQVSTRSFWSHRSTLDVKDPGIIEDYIEICYDYELPVAKDVLVAYELSEDAFKELNSDLWRCVGNDVTL